jgi:hypothetical protein
VGQRSGSPSQQPQSGNPSRCGPQPTSSNIRPRSLAIIPGADGLGGETGIAQRTGT